MFFEGIGIDLHFLYHGGATSDQAARIFNFYINAGRQFAPDGTIVAAFLLNELGTQMVKYRLPSDVSSDGGASPPNSDGTFGKEHVFIEAGHTCGHAPFAARIWRPSSVLDAPDDIQDDKISVQVIHNDPEQGNRILHEAGPFTFPAKQSSIWINVGLTAAFLQYDIRVKVERPSCGKIIAGTYRYKQPDPTVEFYGVNKAQAGHDRDLHPRIVIAGSEEEAWLSQYIDAYLCGESTSPHAVVVPAPSQAPAAANDKAVPLAAPISHDTSPTLTEASSEPSLPFGGFQTLLGFPPAATQPTAQAPVFTATTQTPAKDDAPTSISPKTVQRSPPLASRAWNAFKGAASVIAPILPGPSPALASFTPPVPGQIKDKHVLQGDISSTDRFPKQVQSGTQQAHSMHTNADVMPSGGQGVVDAAKSGESSYSVNKAATDLGHAASTQQRHGVLTTDQHMHADPAQQNAKVTGVSYSNDADVNMSSGPAGPSPPFAQPLVLPGSSGTLPASMQGNQLVDSDKATPSAADGQHASSGATQVDGAGDLAIDIQMEDGEAVHQQNTNAAEGSSSNIDGRELGANTDPTAAHATQGTLNGTLPVAGDGDAQIVSMNTSTAHSAENQAVVPSSSNSDIPLAQLRADQPAQSEGAAPNAGAMMLARTAPSHRTTPSQAGSEASRRHRGSHISGSIASSMRSSMRSGGTLFAPSLERKQEICEYLTSLVTRDMQPDRQKANQLADEVRKTSNIFEAAKRKYELELRMTGAQQQMNKSALKLKRDTIRMIRKEYDLDMRAANWRGRTVEGSSRMGSERARSRSRSRTVESARAPSVAGSRRGSRAPSEVPRHLFKRERLDTILEETRSSAGNSRQSGSRAPSVAPNGGSSRRVTPAPASTCKVGNVADLMRAPRIQPKLPASAYQGRSAAATSRTGTESTVRPASLPNHPIDEVPGNVRAAEWVARQTCSRTTSRTSTPAPGSMGPPPVPHRPFNNADSPIELDNDVIPSSSQRAAIREGKQRLRSRAPSVSSRVSRARSSTPAVRDGSAPAAAIAIDDDEVGDNGSDAENRDPLFQSQRVASVATSLFSELHDA